MEIVIAVLCVASLNLVCTAYLMVRLNPLFKRLGAPALGAVVLDRLKSLEAAVKGAKP